MEDESRRWAAELRERHDLPPAGVPDAKWRLEQSAETAFRDFFKETAPKPLAVGEDGVLFEHRGALIVFDPTTSDLPFQPRDQDGHRYGARTKLDSIAQAVALLESDGINRQA